MHSSYALAPPNSPSSGTAPRRRSATSGRRLPARRPPRRRARPARWTRAAARTSSAARTRSSTTTCATTARRRQLLPLRRHVPDRRRLRARRLQPARRLADAQVRGVLQPTAEARARDASTTAASRCSCCPRRALRCRGEVVLSTWNALPRTGPLRRHLLAAHGQARGGDVGAARQQDRRELRRAGDLLDARHRRRRAGPPAPAAPRHRPRAAAQLEEYRTLPNAAAARALLGVTRGAAAGPPGGLAPLARRRSSCRSRCRCRRSTSALRPARRPGGRGGPTTRTPAPSAAHRTRSCTRRSTRSSAAWAAVRRVGGLGLDLRLRRSRRRAPRGARDGRHLGRVAAAEVALPRPRRARRGRLLLHERHGRRSRSARCATAPFCDERGKMLGDGTVYNAGENDGRPAGRDGAADRRRPLPPRHGRQGLRRRGRRAHGAPCRTCSCRARARASCSPR